MRLTLVAGLLISCALVAVAPAQTQSAPVPLPHRHNERPAPPETTALPASAASVTPSDAVITVKGLCQAPDAAKNGCTDAVTREQFEKLTNALKPDMGMEMRRNFALNYGKLLIFYDAARTLGLENDPKVQQIFKFAQKQILLEALNQHYSDEYSHPTDQQIQDYYNQNSKKYREATLQRVIIPRVPATAEKPQPSETELKAYAEQVRKQWLDGTDPATLQKDAMTKMGLTSPPPDVNLGTKQPGTLPVQHEVVFDLKAGEISQPLGDPVAFYLYKVVSARPIPVAEVKDSISKTLHDQELKDKIQQLSESAKPELNEAYFGKENVPGPPSSPGPGPGPSAGTASGQPAPASSNEASGASPAQPSAKPQ